jgi:hypothetical protein
MAVIEMSNVIEGTLGGYTSAGAPSAGTNEVQTLTIGGTPTGGTFKLAQDGIPTADITWSATNATLLSNINAALDAAFGTSFIVATAGTLTAGIGTVTLTYSGGSYARRAMSTRTVANNSLTGTSPTLAVAETTPGVDATARFAAKGAQVTDTTNGKLYIVTASNPPTFTVVGTQT